MPKFWITFCNLLVLISSAVYADRYKERTFKVKKTANIIYASNVPQLSKKHFVTSLATGLKLPSDVVPTLYFYQNASETSDVDLYFDLYQPENDESENRPLVIIVHGGAFVSGSKSDNNQSIMD